MVWYKAFAGLAQPQIKVHAGDQHSTKQEEEQDPKSYRYPEVILLNIYIMPSPSNFRSVPIRLRGLVS
jgi:hypothetical protein